MDRKAIGLTVFFAAAFVGIIAMIATGRPRHPRPAAAVAATAESGATGVVPGKLPAGAVAAAAELEASMGGMQMPPGYRTTNARNFMRMRLRELAMGEEQFYNESSAYTTDLSKLLLPRRTGDVVVLRVTFAGPAGWSAEATHPAMIGKSCVTYTGPPTLLPRTPETMADRTQPLGERDLVCDKP